MASALSSSGLMLGFAYYQTFVTDSVQILKGGGWRSVANLSKHLGLGLDEVC